MNVQLIKKSQQLFTFIFGVLISTLSNGQSAFDTFKDQSVCDGTVLNYTAKTSATAILQFNKANKQYVELNSLSDDLAGTNRSIFMWAKSPVNVTSSSQMLFAINTASGGNVSLLVIPTDEYLEVYDGSNSRNSGIDLGDDAWHYVGYTYNDTTNDTKIYVDGVLVREFTNGQTLTADAQISLGQEFDGGKTGNFFDGQMTEISVWNDVLDAADIAIAMQSKITASHNKYANLVGYYNGFGATGQDTAILEDKSGKGNTVNVMAFALDYSLTADVAGYNAIDWYTAQEWYQNESLQTTATTLSVAATSATFELKVLRDNIVASDVWETSIVANTETIDKNPDQSICSNNQLTYTATTHKIAPFTFSKTDERFVNINSLQDDLADSHRSVFMWVKSAPDVASDPQALFAINTNTGDNVSLLLIGENEHLELHDGSTTHDSGFDLGDDAWHYVGYTYDSTENQTKVYVDGILVDTINNNQDAEATNTYSLGQEFDGGLNKGNFYDGLMTEVSVWKVVLNESDILSAMTDKIENTHAQYANLMAYYGFPECGDNSSILKDWTANNNDGKITGTITSTTTFQEIAAFNSAGWFTKNWFKNGVEISTNSIAKIWPFEGTDSYELTLERPFYALTENWDLTYSENITTQPQDVSVHETDNAIFNVNGVTDADYQWYQKYNVEDYVYKEYGSATTNIGTNEINEVTISDGTIYLATELGVSVSYDDGETWVLWNTSSKNFPETICKNVSVYNNVIIVRFRGNTGWYSYSLDGGATFSHVNSYNSSKMSFGGFQHRPSNFTFDEQGFLYATTWYYDNFDRQFSLLKSTNSGVSFAVVGTYDFPDNANLSAGLPEGSLLIDGNNFIIATGRSGFLISTNGGEEFTLYNTVNSNLPNNGVIDVALYQNKMYLNLQNFGLPENRGLYKIDITANRYIYEKVMDLDFFNFSEMVLDKNYLYLVKTGYGDSNGLIIYDTSNRTTTVGDVGNNTGTMVINNGKIYTGSNEGFYAQILSEKLEGETAASLTIENTTANDDENKYLVVVAKDGCTNESDVVKLFVKTGDIVKPILESITPADEATGVTVEDGMTFTLDFDENIQKGTGTILIRNKTDKSYVTTIEVVSSEVSINNDVATITPTASQVAAINTVLNAGNTDFYVEVPKEAFTDLNGNTFAGILETQWDYASNVVITINWTGTTNTDWATTTNWDSSAVPTAIDNVVIPNVTRQPIVARSTTAISKDLTLETAASLTLATDAALTVHGNFSSADANALVANSGSSVMVTGTATGNVLYNRNVLTTNWHFISSPVNGESVKDFLTGHNFEKGSGTTPNRNVGLAQYKNDGTFWNYYVDGDFDGLNADDTTDLMAQGEGYSIKLATPSAISFSGTINTSSVNTRTITQGSSNFNLVGNPFMAYLKLGDFFASNAAESVLSESTTWFWDGSTYETKSALVDGDFKIAPAQAFFVSAGVASVNTTFDISNVTHEGTDTFLKSSDTRPQIKLFMTDGSNSRATRLFYIDGTTTGFDNGYDGTLFGGVTQSFALYTHLVSDSVGQKLGLQVLPPRNYENTMVPIGVNALKGTAITFTTASLNLPKGIAVFIEDKQSKTFTRIDEANSTYAVTLTETENDIGRFFLHTSSSVLSASNFNLENVSMYKSDKETLRIVGLSAGKTQFKLFTVLGKQVMSSSFQANGVKDISVSNLAAGIYIVELETEKGTLNKKIILE